MSAEAMTVVWEHGKGTPGQRNTLLALANRADEHGICWPGIPELVKKTKMTRRGVQYALRALEKSGQLERLEGAEGGRGVTPLYWIKLPGLDGDTKGANRRRKGANRRQTKGADDDSKGRNLSPERANPTSPEPLREPSEEPTDPPSEAPHDDQPVEEFRAWLSHHWATTGIDPPPEGSKAWRSALRVYGERLLEGYTPEKMELAIDGAATDDWRRAHHKLGIGECLKATELDQLVADGRTAREQTSPVQQQDWVAWVAKELPDFEGAKATHATWIAQMLAGGGWEVTPEVIRKRVEARRGPDAEAA